MTELLSDVELKQILKRYTFTAEVGPATYDICCLLSHIKAQDKELAVLRAKLNRYAPPELTDEATNVASVRYVYSNFDRLQVEDTPECECCENGRKCRCGGRDEDF